MEAGAATRQFSPGGKGVLTYPEARLPRATIGHLEADSTRGPLSLRERGVLTQWEAWLPEAGMWWGMGSWQDPVPLPERLYS